MKKMEWQGLNLTELSEIESRQITGGCMPYFCLGKIVGAIEDFWEGVCLGFDEGARAGSKV